MKTFKVDLNPLQKQYKYQPYIFSIMGLLYIILRIFNLTKYDEYNFHGWFFVITGIIFLFMSYYNKTYSSKLFFEIGDDFIQVKQSIKKVTKFKWSKIKEINIKPITLELVMSNKTKEEISLGNVGYKNVIDIKSKLLEIAKEKNTKVN